MSLSGGSGCSVGSALSPGSRRSSSRSCSGAVTITLRSWTSATRRTSTALRRESSSTRSASWRWPARGSGAASRPRVQHRAARIASSGSSLPRSRRSARAWRPTLEHRLAAIAEVTSEPGTVMAGTLDRPDTHAASVDFSRSAAPARSRARSHEPTVCAMHRSRGCDNDSEHVLIAVRVDTDLRNPPRLQASRSILRLDSQGPDDAGLDAGKPRGRSVMSHAEQGGQAPDQANSGRHPNRSRA